MYCEFSCEQSEYGYFISLNGETDDELIAQKLDINYKIYVQLLLYYRAFLTEWGYMFVTKEQCEIFISKELKTENYLNFKWNTQYDIQPIIEEKLTKIKIGKNRKINIIE